jgi:hypothetical protein
MSHSCIDVNRLLKDIGQAVCKTKKKHAACSAMDHTKYEYAFIANYFLSFKVICERKFHLPLFAGGVVIRRNSGVII